MSSAVRSEVSKPDDEMELYDKDMPEAQTQHRSLSRSPSQSPREHRPPRSPEDERRGYSPARQSSPARRFIRPVSGNYGSAGGNNNPRAPVIDVLSKFPMTCHFWKNNSCIRGAEKCSYIHGFVCRDDPNCKRGNACRDVHVKLQRFQKNNPRDQRGRTFDHKPGYGVGYRRDDGYPRPNRGGRGNFHARRFQREDHRSFHDSVPQRARERDSWNDEYRRNQAEHRGRGRPRSRSHSREEGLVRHRSRSPRDGKFDRYRSRSQSRDGRTQRNRSHSLSKERKERYGSRSLSADKESYRSHSRSPKRRSRSKSVSRERRRRSNSGSSQSSSSRDESCRTGKRRRQSPSRSSGRRSDESRGSSAEYKLHSLLDGGRATAKSQHPAKNKETLATMDPEKAASLLKDDMELSEGTIEKLMDSIKAKNKDTSAEQLKTKGRRHDKDHEESRRAPLFPISVPFMAPPPPKLNAKDLDGHVALPSHRTVGGGAGKDMWTPAMDRPSYDPRVTGVALSRWEIETPLLHRDDDGEGGGRGRAGTPSSSSAAGGVSAAGLSSELDSLFSNTFDTRERLPSLRRSPSPQPGSGGGGRGKDSHEQQQQQQNTPVASKRCRSDSSESSSSEGSDDDGKQEAGGDPANVESKSALMMKKSSILKNMQMLMEQKQRLDLQKEDLTRSHRGSDEVLQGILSENALLNEEITKQLQNMCTLIEEINKSIEAAPEKDDDASASKGKLKKTKKKTRKKRKKEKRSKEVPTPQSADKKISRIKRKLSKEKSKERDEDELMEEKVDEPVAKSPVVAPRYWDIVKPLSLSVTDEANADHLDDESPEKLRRKDYYDMDSPREGNHRADHRHRDGDRNRRFDEPDEHRRREGSWEEPRNDAVSRDGQRWHDFRGAHWRNDFPQGEFRRDMKTEGDSLRGAVREEFPDEMARGARNRDEGREDYPGHRRGFGFRRGHGRDRPGKEEVQRRPYWEERDRDANQHDRDEKYHHEKYPELDISRKRSYSNERASREEEEHRYRSYSRERIRDCEDQDRVRKCNNYPDTEEGPASSGSRGRVPYDNERPNYRSHDKRSSYFDNDKPGSPVRLKQAGTSNQAHSEETHDAVASVKPEKGDDEVKPVVMKAEQRHFIDQGMHWCELCSVFCETLQLFADHLRSASHLDNLKRDENSLLAGPEGSGTEEALQASYSRPLVGVEFVQSVVALYCSLCRCYVAAAGRPEGHLHSAQHIASYEGLIQKEPLYESTFLKAKMNAYAKFMMSQSQPEKTGKAADFGAPAKGLDVSIEMEPPLQRSRAPEFTIKEDCKETTSRGRDRNDEGRTNTERVKRFSEKFESGQSRGSTRSHFEGDAREFSRFDRLATEKVIPRAARQYRSHREEEDSSHPRKTPSSPKSKPDSRSKGNNKYASEVDSNVRRRNEASSREARQNQQSIRVVARAFGAQAKTDDEKSEPDSASKTSVADLIKQTSKKSVGPTVVEMVATQVDENEKILEELKKKVASRIREKREAQSLKDEEEARLREKEEKEARKKLEEKLDKFAKKQPVVEEKKNHSRFPLIGKMPFFKSKPMKSVSGKAAKESDSSDKDDKERREQRSGETHQPLNGSASMQDIQDPKFVRHHTDETEAFFDPPSSGQTKTTTKERAQSQDPPSDQISGSGNSSTSNDTSASGVQNQLLKVLAMNKQRSESPGTVDTVPSSSPARVASSTSSISSSNNSGPQTVTVSKPPEPLRPTLSFPTYSIATEAMTPTFQTTFVASPVTCVPSFVRTVPPPGGLPAPPSEQLVLPLPPPGHYSSPVHLQRTPLPSLGLPDYSALVNRPPPPPCSVESPATSTTASANSVDERATPPPPGTEAGDDDVRSDVSGVSKPTTTRKVSAGGEDDDENLLPPGIDPSDVEDSSPEKGNIREESSGLDKTRPAAPALDSASEILAHAIPTKAQIETRLAQAGQLLAKK